MEVVNKVLVPTKSSAEHGVQEGLKVATRHVDGIAEFTVDSISSICYIARARNVETTSDRARYYHDLLVSKVREFASEIEAVMKEISQ